MIDCTLLIQGKINEESFNLWIQNYKDWNVILSTWEDEDLSKYKIPKKWKIILSSYPKKRFAPSGNFDYQIITTINGLRNINNKFVIKVRADEYWSNLLFVYELMLSSENKIISSSMFFRKFGMYDFHIGDKIIAGQKENIELMFNIAYNIVKEDVLTSKIPETYLGLGYLVGKKEILFDEKFILSLNNKETKFDRESSIDAIKSAYKTVKKNFELILKNEKAIDIKKVSEILSNTKDILNYCYGYNELAIKLKNRINTNELEQTLMKKHFEIVNINKLKPYIATTSYGAGGKRIWYRDDFDNEKENCLETLN